MSVKPGEILRDFSFEITCKDISKLDSLMRVAAPGSLVSLTFLPNEDVAARIAAASAVRAAGFVPVPHIAARRLASPEELEHYLEALVSRAGVDRVFVIAGDVATIKGPYPDALSVLRSSLLNKYKIAQVGISGYPTGHPKIPDGVLWQAMRDKLAILADMGHRAWIMTQFGFEATAILDWLARSRLEGNNVPVCIGVAGPSSVRSLLHFAALCGVETSAKVVAKYGLSIGKLLGSVGPDAILKDLASGLNVPMHGPTAIHFYPFGGLGSLGRWIEEFRRSSEVEVVSRLSAR